MGLSKICLEGAVERRRNKGRPKKRWRDIILTWSQLDVTELNVTSKDRARWKTLSRVSVQSAVGGDRSMMRLVMIELSKFVWVILYLKIKAKFIRESYIKCFLFCFGFHHSKCFLSLTFGNANIIWRFELAVIPDWTAYKSAINLQAFWIPVGTSNTLWKTKG